MSQSLRTTALLSLSIGFIVSTAFAQPPRRPEGFRPPREADRLQEGDLAPDFTLKSPDGKKTIKLSDFRGKKPVALVFGSYTWPPFRRQSGVLDKMYDDHNDQVEFFLVYIREAHPTDGWQTRQNERQNIFFKQPTKYVERVAVAMEMCTQLKLKMPPLIDRLDDKVNKAYNAEPDRLYLVGIDGKIIYQGARGPRGFDPAELERAILETTGKK